MYRIVSDSIAPIGQATTLSAKRVCLPDDPPCLHHVNIHVNSQQGKQGSREGTLYQRDEHYIGEISTISDSVSDSVSALYRALYRHYIATIPDSVSDTISALPDIGFTPLWVNYRQNQTKYDSG